MRPGQNKRMRGRNGRKGPNPLTRSYESNGPDVKIRGTAHHIAEKYLQLARDAHSSGDPVMAESYLQHAEHYFRLIAAAQQAQLQAQQGYQRPAGEPEPDEIEDDDGGVPDRFASPAERFPPQQPYQNQQQPYGGPPQAQQPQPYGERPPFGGEQRPQQGQDRGQDRGQERGQERGPDRNQERSFGGERPQGDRPQGEGPRGPRPDRGFDRPRDNRPPRDQRFPPRDRGDQPRFDRGPREAQPAFVREAPPAAEQPSLPAFITGPARTPAPSAEPQPDMPPAVSDAFGAPDDPAMEAARFPLRSRRRRRRPGEEGVGAEAAEREPGDAPAGE